MAGVPEEKLKALDTAFGTNIFSCKKDYICKMSLLNGKQDEIEETLVKIRKSIKHI